MLIIKVVQVLSTAGVGFIGQTHFDFSSFLLQRQDISRRNWRLRSLRSLRFFLFFLLFAIAFRLFWFRILFGCHLQRFLLFGHGGFVESFYYVAFHHEGGDFVLEVGLANVHEGVHLLNAPLLLVKIYHVKFEKVSDGLSTERVIHLDGYFPL